MGPGGVWVGAGSWPGSSSPVVTPLNRAVPVSVSYPALFRRNYCVFFFFQELIALEQIVSNLRLIKHSK